MISDRNVYNMHTKLQETKVVSECHVNNTYQMTTDQRVNQMTIDTK